MSKVSKQQGFTLLEVMIVVVIIGVLASLIVPSLMGNKEKADRQKAAADIVALENALEMYRLDNGRYPSQAQGLPALVSKPTQQPVPQNYSAEGYIRRLPQDPWGNDYRYANPGSHGLIDLYSVGNDETNPDSQITNWERND